MTESTNNKPLLIESYNYELPDERIAKYPLTERDASKLLVYKNGKISESRFSELAEVLPEGCLLVYNNTRVIHARLVFYKSTGARIEVFCLEPVTPSDYALSLSSAEGCEWKCLVGNLKKWKAGKLTRHIELNGRTIIFSAEKISTSQNTHRIRFDWDDSRISFSEILECIGELPIPPYLNRDTEASDEQTYQTVYSKVEGSVAAPTAGLHFTDAVFESLRKKLIELEELTLHVGAGTFQPVKAEDVSAHIMHTETIAVPLKTIRHIRKNLGNIIAVGTTSVRTLESLYYVGCGPLSLRDFPLKEENSTREVGVEVRVGQWEPYSLPENPISANEALQNIIDYLEENGLDTLHAETQILIKPGFRFRVINGMITNFHQPKSTLLLLVSAFAGKDWKQIYDFALENDFRFLSYGDSSVLLSDLSPDQHQD